MPTRPLDLARLAEHVAVEPGGEIRLKGSYHSTFDGAEIDAATTTWPADAPGGASIDAGGLIDFKAGGFHVTSRDPKTHEVVAVATGDPAPICAKLGVQAPCLPLRMLPLSQSRLITMDEWRSSLKGAISLEVVAPPPPAAYAPVVDVATHPATLGAVGVAGLAAIVGLTWMIRRRQKLSPTGQMRDLVSRVSKKLSTADAVFVATVSPALKRARAIVDERRVDPTSKEGQRVREILLRVESRLDEAAADAKAAKEQEVADELAAEIEAALEAAREVDASARRI
jgi:hypothetical protein